MINKKSTFILLAALIAIFLLSACTGSTPEGTATPATAIDDFVPIVSATGKVVPAEWSTLSMKTAGVVAEVLVDEDDMVKTGQVLIRLEGAASLEAAIAAARFEVVAAKRALDTLYDDPEVALGQAQQAIVIAKKAVNDAERRLTNYSRTGSQLDIDQAYANMILAQDLLDKAEDKYEPYRDKAETNLARAAFLSKLAQAQKDYDRTVRLYNSLISTGNALDIDEADADLTLAQAQLDAALRRFEILQDGPDPDDVAVAEARLDNANAHLTAAQSMLDDLELKALFAGTIGDLYIHAGEWVVPGQRVLLLADLSHLRIETTDLGEIDVAQIHIDSIATITFDALPDAVARGVVTRIAPKDAEGSGVNYPVMLEVDNIPDGLRWGMTAFVDIEVGDE